MPEAKRTNRPPIKHVQKQKSIGAVILNAKQEVLVMYSTKNKYWEFPKGKMEQGEKELDTLKREMEEETGIKRFRLNPAFREFMRYQFRVGDKLIRKVVVYYLFKTGSQVNVSDEHTDFKWVHVDEVDELLRHENQRKLMRRVRAFLKENEI